MVQTKQPCAITFSFPTVKREIHQVDHIRIEPFWEREANKIIGIYRVVVELTFGDETQKAIKSQTVEVDAIDLTGDQGYFEYALSFEGEANIQTIAVDEVQGRIAEQCLVVEWDSWMELAQAENTLKKDTVVEHVPVESELVHNEKIAEETAGNVAVKEVQAAKETQNANEAQAAKETQNANEAQVAKETQNVNEAKAAKENQKVNEVKAVKEQQTVKKAQAVKESQQEQVAQKEKKTQSAQAVKEEALVTTSTAPIANEDPVNHEKKSHSFLGLLADTYNKF